MRGKGSTSDAEQRDTLGASHHLLASTAFAVSAMTGMLLCSAYQPKAL